MVTIPLAAPARHLISVEAFHRMGETGILGPADRVELIDGEIIDRSPIGALHAAIVDLLARHFGRSAQASVFIRCQNPLRLDDLSEPEPDIAIPGLGTFSSRVVNDSPFPPPREGGEGEARADRRPGRKLVAAERES